MTSQQIAKQVISVKEQLPFSQELHVRIEQDGNGKFKIQEVKSPSLITPPATLAQKLFYKHNHNLISYYLNQIR